MKRYTLLLIFFFSSSALFAQIDTNEWTSLGSYFYQMNQGNAIIYAADSTLDGQGVLRHVSLDQKFWKGYESERDLYYLQDAKKRGSYVQGTVALLSFAFVVGINDQLGAPEWAIASSGVGAFFLMINMFTTPMKANKTQRRNS